MGVPIQRAWQWESDWQHHVPESFVLPKAVSEVVCKGFVEARTKGWMTRLAEYWDFQERRKADEEKYGTYRWILFSERYHVHPEYDINLLRTSGETFSGMLSRLLVSDPNGPYNEGTRLMAYKLRSTFAMHRRARIATEFHGFLQLPSEIRNIVYGLVLLKGTVIVPNDVKTGDSGHVTYWEHHHGYTYERYRGLERSLEAMQRGNRKRKPLGLLQGVSRTVHAEATRVYFGNNQFILPSGPLSRPSLFSSLESIADDNVQAMDLRSSRELERGKNNAALVRDVSVTFDMRDRVTGDYENLCYNDLLRESIDEKWVPPQEALQVLHDQKALELEIVWAERIDAIKWMTLDRLELSLEECYCSIGCCRKVEWVLDRLLHKGPPPGTADTHENVYSSVDWRARLPLVIVALGWKTLREEQLIRDKLGKLRDSFGSTEIQLERHIDRQEPVMDADDLLIQELLLMCEEGPSEDEG